MAAIVSIISRHDLRVYACHLVMYNPLLSSNSYLKHLYISNKTEHCNYKSGCGICKHTCIKAFKRRVDLSYK